MGICDFSSLKDISLREIEDSITRYCRLSGPWLSQFDSFYWGTRLAGGRERLTQLLEIVRGSGWNMNRQGQCSRITQSIKTGSISRRDLEYFWSIVDDLPGIRLSDLPNLSEGKKERIAASIDRIRKTLSSWHQSAGTACFLTKVILMFNWGQTPAFDTRVRSVLKLGSNISTSDLMEVLVEIGVWIEEFEAGTGLLLDDFSTKIVNKHREDLHPLPLGRSFDMLLFSLKR